MKIGCHKQVAKAGAKAFTIVEVVVSVVIIAIGVGGFMGAFNYAYFVMELARENQRATQIMVDKCDTIRLFSWDQVNSTNGFIPATFSMAYDPTSTNGTGINYQGTVSISDFPYTTSYSSNLRQLTITLNWNTRGRVQHTRTNVTFIAKDGLQNYVY